MIACDNPECQMELFHYSCVGIKQKPKDNYTVQLANHFHCPKLSNMHGFVQINHNFFRLQTSFSWNPLPLPAPPLFPASRGCDPLPPHLAARFVTPTHYSHCVR